MKLQIPDSWKTQLQAYISSQSFKKLLDFVDLEYKNSTVYPPKKDVFSAFNHTSFENVSVVILGQDPYHNPGQANGLSFSVPAGVTPPPSLKNIYREIQSDLEIEKDMSKGNLDSWADQGVLLLNSVLTVRQNEPGSHKNQGWEDFTDYVIQVLSEKKEGLVFMLWGNYAKTKGKHIDTSKHLVLKSPHPSPFSARAGFLGNNHFSQCNAYLVKKNRHKIDW